MRQEADLPPWLGRRPHELAEHLEEGPDFLRLLAQFGIMPGQVLLDVFQPFGQALVRRQDFPP